MWSIELYGGFNVGFCGLRSVEGFEFLITLKSDYL
jgi:hypothetical protein